MSRLEDRPTAELWGRSQRYVSHKAEMIDTIEFHKLGLAHMRLHKRELFKDKSMSELMSNHYEYNLFLDIGKTMAYYEKRISDWEKSDE